MELFQKRLEDGTLVDMTAEERVKLAKLLASDPDLVRAIKRGDKPMHLRKEKPEARRLRQIEAADCRND